MNPEHVERIKQGVAEWNAWRCDNRVINLNTYPSRNLRDADLSGADLSNADLTGANLIDADLSDAFLSQANMSDAYLTGANLTGARVYDANMSKANLGHADLSSANLGGAHLNNAHLFDANLEHAYLSSAKLGGANLRNAHLYDAELRYADLTGASLCKAVLRKADLQSADLSNADLTGAILLNADLQYTHLDGASLGDADLGGANLLRADLTGANLRNADLGGANLYYADLSAADLSNARLYNADLGGANMGGANLTDARLNETRLVNVDLSRVIGLATCIHVGPSVVDHRTLQKSGPLPIQFLRGVGLPDNLIDYLPSLVSQAIQHYSCFISYSTKDHEFAERLHGDLQNKGVRCWFARHDLSIGAKTWDAIDEAIKLRDKLLLILSKNSIGSEWVEDEVQKALAEERDRKELVLFPVRIDDAVMKTPEPWARKLRDQRNIGDFRRWKDHNAYKASFQRVLRDLTKPLPQFP